MSLVLLALWSAALLLLPGWVVWRLAGPRSFPWPLDIAPAFALSIALISVIAWAAFVLGLGFSAVRLGAIALAVLAALLLPIAWWRVPNAAAEPISPGWSLWAALAVAVAAGLSALYTGAWMSFTADTFYHLAAVWSVLQHNSALPQEVFYSTPVSAPDPTSGTWQVAVALIANLSGANPIFIWKVMTIAITPLTALAFFTFALAIARNGLAAAIATALYVVLALQLDFRAEAYPNRFGSVLAWLALALVLRYAANDSRRELWLAAAIAFGASAVHPGLSPFLIVALTCAVAGVILMGSPVRTRMAVAAAITGAVALPLLIVNISTLAERAPYAAIGLPAALPLRTVDVPWTWVLPTFWYHNTGPVLGSVLAIGLIRYWRAGSAGAGFLLAALLAIPLAALTPIFASSYNGQYILVRVAALVEPLAWIALGWGIALAVGALRTRLVMPATAVLAVSAIALAGAFYSGPWARFTKPADTLRSFASSRSTDLTEAWRDRLTAISKLPQNAVLLAEPGIAYELAGLTGREVVAVSTGHTPYQAQIRDARRRREDAIDVVQGRLDAAGLAGVLEHYGVTDVLVDAESTDPTAWAKLAGTSILAPIASGDGWRLYRYDRDRLDDYLDLATHDGPRPDLQRSGVGPAVVVAGRAVFVRLEPYQGAVGDALLEAHGLSSNDKFSRQIVLGDQPSQTAALLIPADAAVDEYALNLVMSDGRTLPLGRFDVGRLFQAEDLGSTTLSGSTLWKAISGRAYQGGLAATSITPGATAYQPSPPIAAGSYCVAARVWDDGTGRANRIDVSVGTDRAELAWSGSSQAVRVVEAPLTLDSESGQLVMKMVQRGQSAVTVDSLEIFPAVEGACGTD